MQLNSTFHCDSPILTLLTIIYSSLFHITAVSKHIIFGQYLCEESVRLDPFSTGACIQTDLYCVEWDVKLYYTIPYQTEMIPFKLRSFQKKWLNVKKHFQAQLAS